MNVFIRKKIEVVQSNHSINKEGMYPVYNRREYILYIWIHRVYIIYNQAEIYLVYMNSSCIYHIYELTKFKRNLKKFTHVLSILLHLGIKFQS
jgi:hypothetical protein